MRIYSATNEEALRARDLLKDWADEALLTQDQYRRTEQETVSDLRRTNIFLRLVHFFFTLIIVGAALGLFFRLFLDRASTQAIGIALLLCAAIAYAASELAVSRFHLYRYGIEEALAISSGGFLCVGILLIGQLDSLKSNAAEFRAFTTGALASLWIWHRFGLPYSFLAAMTFVIFLPGYWTSSHQVQHLVVAAFYSISLLAIAAIRPRHRLTYLNEKYSIAEALLWLGIYLAINLQLSALNQIGRSWNDLQPPTEFSQTFYWTTWILTWCFPPIILTRGIREKDRFVIWAGALATILTLATNKLYLGWPRQTWDPMLLGALLICVALFLRHWLAASPNGIRHGFTAQRLSAKDKSWVNFGAAAFGLASPSTLTPTPQPGNQASHFGGGDSGGGGASSDF